MSTDDAALSPHLRQLIALAWARTMGVPDDVLLAALSAGTRLEVPAPAEHGAAVVWLRAAGLEALVAPEPVLAAARGLSPEELALESVLLRLCAPWSPRSAGEQTLLHLEEPPEIAPSDTVAVSDDPDHALALAAQCPADDVAAAALPTLAATHTLVRDRRSAGLPDRPLATAGHAVAGGLLADVRVLVRPDVRGHGLGAYAAAVAAQEAWDAGLVPQASVPVAQDGALRLALAVGFVPTGSVTRVELTGAG